MLNKYLHDKTDVTPVDGAQWMIQLYHYLKSTPDIGAAGILDCIAS
jgi:hypothetical protein